MSRSVKNKHKVNTAVNADADSKHTKPSHHTPEWAVPPGFLELCLAKNVEHHLKSQGHDATSEFHGVFAI